MSEAELDAFIPSALARSQERSSDQLFRPSPEAAVFTASPFTAIRRLAVEHIEFASPAGSRLLRQSAPALETPLVQRPVSILFERDGFAPAIRQSAVDDDALWEKLEWDAAQTADTDEAVAEFAAPEPEPVDVLESDIVAAELARVRQEAFDAGVAEGRRVLAAETENAAAHAAHLAIELAALHEIDQDSLGDMLHELVVSLAGQVIEAQISVDPAFIAERVCRALQALSGVAEPVTLQLHPADHALLTPHMTGQSGRTLKPVADASLRRGSIRLATSEMLIDDCLEERLEQLRRAMRAERRAAGRAPFSAAEPEA